MSDSAQRFAEALISDPATSGWLERCTGGRAAAVESVQELWSGYGRILRVRLAGAPVDSVVVKYVSPPREVAHPRGWSGRAGDERKRRSYDVERCFYSRWNAGGDPTCRTAKCFAAEAAGGSWRFVLEDLDAAGYAARRTRPGPGELDRCLAWLAAFHARFLGREPTGLWPTGTYWHLSTRAAELAALEDAELRAAAPRLDEVLRAGRHRTLVHGDAKVANFCFAVDGVAAVDFQYVGGGCGIQDVAYFLSSCLDDAECEAAAPRHLDTYFSELRARLDPAVDGGAVEAEWRALYPAAWADFHRFLAGWAPGHWKIHDYTRRMTRLALAGLDV